MQPAKPGAPGLVSETWVVFKQKAEQSHPPQPDSDPDARAPAWLLASELPAQAPAAHA
jgi:hypothetical protein